MPKHYFRVAHLAAVASLFFSNGLLSSAQAQSYFHYRADFAVGNSPVAVISADFDGNGRPDLAVVNQADNTVSILLGLANGSFSAQKVFATGNSPVALAAADFNHDGKLDLAVVNGGAGTVSILLGNGDGTFQSHVDYAVGADPSGIVAADFNGDQKIDLAVSNQGDNTVSILLGDGNGTFAPANSIAVGAGPIEMVAADFNGDGKLDLMTADSGAKALTELLSKGNGTFTRTDLPLAILSIPDQPTALAVGDFNRDGMLDVYVALLNVSPAILLGNGDGTFQPVHYVDGPSSTLAVAADFNGDGNLDLAVAQEATADMPYPFVQIWLGAGNGSFQSFADSSIDYAVGSLTVADLNGDGIPDLAVTSLYGNTVSVILNPGDAAFDAGLHFFLDSFTNVGPMVVTDLNGDGFPDVAWAAGCDSCISLNVLLGDGKGGLNCQPQATLPARPDTMVAGYFTDDGIIDLAMGGEFMGNEIDVYPGNGLGGFGPRIITTMPASTYATQLVAAKFGSATDLLVAWVNSPGTGLTLYDGQGDGTFVAGANLVPSATGNIYSAVGDFNGDGKLDLAYLVSPPGTLVILPGNGDGTFQSPISYTVPLAAGPPVVADVNGDGKADLIIPAASGLNVFLGNGNGTFRPPMYTQISEGEDPAQLVTGDFNDDGKLDVAVLGPFAVLFGNGDGTFAPPHTFAAGPSSRIGAGDFNSDGVPELVVGSPNVDFSSSVELFLSAPFISLSAAAVSFGAESVGQVSPAQNVTLANIGNAPMRFSSLTATGGFTQTNNCPASLLPEADCVVMLELTPGEGGPQEGSLIVADNLLISPQRVALSGTGLGAGPIVNLSPSQLEFGAQLLTTTSAAQTVTLTNSGNEALVITSITAGGDAFQTNTCGSSVAANGSCTLSVSFAPTADGYRTGTITLTDSSGTSPQSITLSGTGEDFTLTVPTGSYNTADVARGFTAAYTLSLAGIGGMNQPVNFSCTGAPAGAVCTVNPTSATPTPSGSVSISVSVTTAAPAETLLPVPGGRPPGPTLGVSSLLGALILILALASWRFAAGQAGGRKMRWMTAMAVVASLALLLTACGSGGGSANNAPPAGGGTPPGNYTLTVTGTAAGGVNLQHSVSLTLGVS